MNAPVRVTPAFRYRKEPCEFCDDGWQSSDAYGDRRCEECGGTGLATQSCECCERDWPLDDDGLCRDCSFLTDCQPDPLKGVGEVR